MIAGTMSFNLSLSESVDWLSLKCTLTIQFHLHLTFYYFLKLLLNKLLISKVNMFFCKV